MSNQQFKEVYAVLSTDSWSATNEQKQAFEESTNILLPETALQLLTASNCQLPFTFAIKNNANPSYTTYVGVQEFSLKNSGVIMPNRILQQLHNPVMVIVKYTALPSAESIELYPNNTNFIQQHNYITHIRAHLCKVSCISICDTLQIEINNTIYTLTVTNYEPSYSNAISLHNKVDTVDIKLYNYDNNQEESSESEGCPLVSNITSTDNGNVTKGEEDHIHTMGADDDMDISDVDQYEFDSQDNGDWGDDAESYDSYDGQQYLPLSKPKEFTPPPQPKEFTPPVPDPNSTDDGNSRKLKPVLVRAQHRAWICEFCHSINNLMESIKRQYKCVACDGKYRPGQKIIESKEEDGPLVQVKRYEVWECVCSRVNIIALNQCGLCHTAKPNEGIVSFWTEEEPAAADIILDPLSADAAHHARGWLSKSNVNVGVHEDASQWRCSKCNWRNTVDVTYCTGCSSIHNGAAAGNSIISKKRRQYYGNLAIIGDVKSISQYPVVNCKHKVNGRLTRIFGKPYQNSLILTERNCNKWITNNSIGCSIMSDDLKDIKIPLLPPRRIALNETTGDIAIITGMHKYLKRLIILRPYGGNGFKLIGYKTLQLPMDCNVTRVRFVGDAIYVFSGTLYKVFVYCFVEETKHIMFLTEIFEPYFKEAAIVDILVTKDLFIILFDRWIGVYTMYPKLEWYHAVSFAANDKISVRSLEMSVFDESVHVIDEEDEKNEEKDVVLRSARYLPSIKNYLFINCENKLVAVHASNPTFDIMHVADNVRNGTSYCNSKCYGTFYISNEGDQIYQSWRYSAQCTKIICSLEDDFNWTQFHIIPIAADKPKHTNNIDRFAAVLYDEMFGISGRLLVQCRMKDTFIDHDDMMFYQLYNQDELMLLKQELERTEYCLMPGTNEKPFNLIVFVYEMLYGTDIIDAWLQSPDFNPVYVIPGNEQVKEEEKEENVHVNKLLNVGSKCLVYMEGRWYDGIVASAFNNNDDDNKEYVTLSILLDSHETCTKSMYKYDKRLKYNEPIPLRQHNKLISEWNIGDTCLYYLESHSRWYVALITDKIKDMVTNIGFLKITYVDSLDTSNEVSLPCNDELSVKLYKLNDVVNEKAIHENKVVMEQKGEDDIEDDYVAVEHDGIMNRNGEEDDDDDDDVDMEMEIELEGVYNID